MNKSYIYILLALLVACIAGCNKMEDDLQEWEVIGNNTISLYCNLENNTSSHLISGKLGTKALVDQTTSVDSLLCNFLSIDEQTDNAFNNEGYVTDWGNALVSEGSIATIPDNSVGTYNLRSISLHPEKAYHSEGENRKSRMIGWYPKNIVLPVDSNLEETDVSFKSFDTIYELINDEHCVKFTGLDGSVDLMVSDVRDGSLEDKFDSDNFFQFKHYLSAVRIHAKAEESAQDIGAWGYIENVIIMNQPTSCVVELPSAPSQDGTERVYGNVVSWGDYMKHPIVTTAIYGNKDQSEGNITAQKYPIKLDGTGVEKYLGYSLIKPNDKLWVQVHTRSGIYDVEIAPKYKQNGQSEEVDIFNAGYIYDLHLNFNTDGTIYAFIGIDGSDRYYDLTTGLAFDDNAGGSGYEYKWANCYVVRSELSAYNTPYTGFCFDATVVGNGEDGQMSIGAQSLYPANVHISPSTADLVWETSPGLISQIELVFGYVRFKVAKKDESNYREGNAVIAVYDQNGKVMWSWHIWITDTPQNFYYTEGEGESSTTITMLDRNLGATAASWTGANDALETYGLYYQWGRKDPSMGPPTWNYSPINMITAPYYDYSSEEKDAAEVVRFATPTLKDAVENPMYLIMPTAQTQSYYFNWLYEKIDFLWGYNKDEGTNVDKTIYDPCPYGYKVSGGELTDLFSFSGKTISYENYGQIVTLTGDNPKKIYFPYTGYKGVDKGLNSLVCSWKYVGQKADYQSSVVNTQVGHADYMHRTRIYLSRETEWNELNVGNYRGRQIMDHTNRKTAAPVRCVKDEYHNRVIAFITPDKNTISTYTDEVTLQLYAKSFKQPISSATLTIGYHMKVWNNDRTSWTEGEHQEKTISLDDWTTSSDNKIWEQNFDFDFETLFNADGSNEKINFNETTGTFRFMLNVRTADNINKMASAPITIGKNYVEFVDWDAQPAVLPKQQINRTIKIYGDQIPVNVLMFKDSEQEGIDITANLKQSSTSDYKYSYTCTTDGFLTFDTSVEHEVKFRITFEDNGILETIKKTITVCQLEIINESTFEQEEYYIIENADFEDSYVYDNGYYMKTKGSPDYSTLFKIIPAQSNTYKIQNVSSQNYVSIGAGAGNNNAAMYIYTNEDYATVFTLEYSNNSFTIKGTASNRTYCWNLSNINDNLNGVVNTNGNNNHINWKIYKVTLPTNNQ